MCILCDFVVNWERKYDYRRYPVPFYNYFLEKAKNSDKPSEIFNSLLMLLRWKLGRVREGGEGRNGNVVIDGIAFSFTDNDATKYFMKFEKDRGFIDHCLKFRDGQFEAHDFLNYLREKLQLFRRGIVLYVFLMHSLAPDRFPIIDQHVWRAMRAFKGYSESLSVHPTTWKDYLQYRGFFEAFFSSLCISGQRKFDKKSLDRALMSFGKWLKKRNLSVKEEKESLQSIPRKGKYAGKCPICGSKLVWRKARRTGEWYRGCTNFKGGCRWNDRSY